MVQFKVNRGNESDLPILLTDGWVYFCTDTGNVYFDWQDGENVRRTQMNAKYADIIRYHDGSDYIDIDPAEIALKNDIPKIDNTLTADGQAADAKAVGDELNKKISAPSTASVGQALRVKTVDENGMPTEWETADVSETGTASIDPTLTVEGSAADAKAVGDALGKSSWKIYEGTFSGYSYSVNNYNTGDLVPGEFEQFYKEPITIVLDGISYFVENTNPGLDSNGYAICEYGDSSLSKYPFYVKVEIAFANIYKYTISVNTDGEHTFAMYRHVIDIVDSTLKGSGLAADAKAVGDALDTKAPKVMTVYIDGNYNSGWTSNYTSQEIYNHINSGGIAVCRVSAHSALVLSSVDASPGYVEFYGREPIGLYYYNAEKYYRIVIEGSSATLKSYEFYPYAIDRIDTSEGNPVNSRAVRDYAIPIPATAKVGQVLSVKDVNIIGNPTEWEPVDMPKIDPTLSIEGQAADAKAVGEELGKKITVPSTAAIGQTIVVKAVDENGKPTEWEAVDMPGGALNKMYVNVRTSSGFAYLSKDRTFEEIKNHIENGGEVEVLYYNSMTGLPTKYNYALYSVDDSEIRFSSTKVSNDYDDYYSVSTYIISIKSDDSISGKVVYYPRTNEVKEFCHIPVDSDAVYNYAVPIPATAEIGQALVVKAVDENGKPTEWEAADLSGGSETSGAMYVTVSHGTDGIRKDRTFAEMKSHYDNGNRVVVLYYETMSGSSTKYIFEIYSVDDSKMQFSRTRVFNMYDDLYRVDTEIITIQSDETVSKSTVTYQHKHNIDAELSDSSDNAVQNKVVAAALAQKSQVQIITWEDDD